jgi:hypothetical protein
MSKPRVTPAILHQKMKSFKGKMDEKKEYLLGYLQDVFYITEHDQEVGETLKKYMIQTFFPTYLKYWNLCHRIESRFQDKYKAWLEKEITFPNIVYRVLPGSSGKRSITNFVFIRNTILFYVGAGRPEKAFEDLSSPSKRRKTEDLRRSTSTAEITYAASMALRKEGDPAAAQLLKEATTTTPTRARRILQKWKTPEEEQSSMSPEDALSLLISLDLTKAQYEVLRQTALKHKHDLYPSYQSVLDAKKAAYPPGITVSESKVEVPLQELLDQTCESILKVISLSGKKLEDSEINGILYCKWGFDGSSGYSGYKQKILTEGLTDTSVFVSSFVPIRLINSETGEVYWRNPRPSSVGFCRPIRLQWTQETQEVTKTEETYLTEQIDSLRPYTSEFGSSIGYEMMLTMVDGKFSKGFVQFSTLCDV